MQMQMQSQSPDSVVPMRKPASAKRKKLRDLVRIPTLRRFDRELANPNSLLYRKKLLKGQTGSAPRFSKYKKLWVELFNLAGRPTLEQIIQDNEINNWSNVHDIQEVMLEIARDRRKNHMDTPRELLYQRL